MAKMMVTVMSWGGRGHLVEDGVGLIAPHQEDDHGAQDDVDVEELEVADVARVPEQDHGRGELDHAVQGHELEHAERRRQSRTPLPANDQKEWMIESRQPQK